MDRLQNIKASEARMMLQLSNQLHACTDPGNRKRQLLRGLCELVEASVGVCVVLHDDGQGDSRTVSAAEFHAAPSADHPAPSILPSDISPETHAAPALPPIPLCTLESTTILAESALRAMIRLHRSAMAFPPFPVRAQKLVDFFHAEITWIYQPDVLANSPKARALPAGARQTLELLLAGHGEKQIVQMLGLNPNTVHHYVKSIHRCLQVRSRAELLAKANALD